MDANILGVHGKNIKHFRYKEQTEANKRFVSTQIRGEHASPSSLSLKHTYTYKGLSKRKEKYTYMEFYRGC